MPLALCRAHVPSPTFSFHNVVTRGGGGYTGFFVASGKNLCTVPSCVHDALSQGSQLFYDAVTLTTFPYVVTGLPQVSFSGQPNFSMTQWPPVTMSWKLRCVHADRLTPNKKVALARPKIDPNLSKEIFVLAGRKCPFRETAPTFQETSQEGNFSRSSPLIKSGNGLKQWRTDFSLLCYNSAIDSERFFCDRKCNGSRFGCQYVPVLVCPQMAVQDKRFQSGTSRFVFKNFRFSVFRSWPLPHAHASYPDTMCTKRSIRLKQM